jgi:uncharacterized protein (TIGR03437 family)
VGPVLRFFVVLAAAVAPLWAQFTGLATPSDGSVVYFSSTLSLKGAGQPPYGKLFVADETGVRLFRLLPKIEPASTGSCVIGTQYSLDSAEVTSDGKTVAAPGQLSYSGLCNRNLSATDLISAAGDQELPGYVYLSPGGRYAIADTTYSVFSSASLLFLDLQTGQQTPVGLPEVTGPWPVSFPSAGRVIANDGTAIFSFYNGAYLARPGQDLRPFPVPNATPLAIDAAGTAVLYTVSNTLRLLNLQTQQDQLVLADQADASGLSDDGTRALFLRGGQAYIIQTDGTALRQLTSDPARITAAVLSGDGGIVYAETDAGRLLKINAGTGDQVELIGRTPFLTSGAATDAGLAATVYGIGLSDTSFQATPPVPTSLGGVGVLIGDQNIPVLQVSPTSVGFLVPWNIQPAGNQTLTVQASGVHSPFDFPTADILITTGPRAGDVLHQNGSTLVSNASPTHPGELIHVSAVGLGPVSPEVPVGTLAPSTEPLARLASPMTCSDSTVLFAGLQPGSLAHIYQVDLRIGSATGYLQFPCSIGGSEFLFLTLYVVPTRQAGRGPGVPPPSPLPRH